MENPSIDHIIQKIKSEINKRQIKSSEIEEFKNKPFYHILDFYAFDGQEFIKYLYIGILKREADQSGLESHLKEMTDNKFSKEKILKSIYYSEEGKMRKTNILGLNDSCRNRDISKILTEIIPLRLQD